MLLLALLGVSRFYPLSAGILLVTGIASIIFSTSLQTRLQLIVPNEYRGRMMGIYTLLQQGSTPFGALFIGTISEHWNVVAAVEAAASIGGLGLFAAWIYSRYHHNAQRAADVMITLAETEGR